MNYHIQVIKPLCETQLPLSLKLYLLQGGILQQLQHPTCWESRTENVQLTKYKSFQLLTIKP